jgi:phospholipase C
MPDLSRRNLIRHAAVVTGAAVVASAAPATGALARTAARRGRHGDIRDIKHVVILMQENRSFDHYFGSLKGVRGFGDHSVITLPGGSPVWQQPTSAPGQPNES